MVAARDADLEKGALLGRYGVVGQRHHRFCGIRVGMLETFLQPTSASPGRRVNSRQQILLLPNLIKLVDGFSFS